MPGDFREFFDLRRMSEQQLGQIEFVLNSPAYEDSFKPFMQAILYQMNNLWKDRTRERMDKYNDDFLAGGACFGEGLLKFFEMLIHETSLERVHAAMAELTNEQLYDIARENGRVQPVIGLDQPAMPQQVTDPAAEDY